MNTKALATAALMGLFAAGSLTSTIAFAEDKPAQAPDAKQEKNSCKTHSGCAAKPGAKKSVDASSSKSTTAPAPAAATAPAAH